MSELPEKQIKRLRGLIQEAETNLAAAKELLTVSYTHLTLPTIGG